MPPMDASARSTPAGSSMSIAIARAVPGTDLAATSSFACDRLSRIVELARQAGLRGTGSLAAQLLLLMDGAWVAARVFARESSPAADVGAAARALVEAHRPKPPTSSSTPTSGSYPRKRRARRP